MSIRKHYLDVINVLYEGRHRLFIDKAIEVLEKEWNRRNVFIIEAPTGYGKTAISLTIAKYSFEEELKAIIAYPLRTLLSQHVELFKKFFKGCGFREEAIGVRCMMTPQSPYLIKPVTLTTVDTLALTTMGVAPNDLGKVLYQRNGQAWGSMGHYIFAWASAFTSNIVVDEAHLLADSGKALAFLSFLARAVVLHDQHLVIMTATLPPHLPKMLEDGAGYAKVVSISFSDYLRGARKKLSDVGDDFINNRLSKEYVVETLPTEEGVEEVMEWISMASEDSSLKSPRVLAVFNTIDEAVRAYRVARRKFKGGSDNVEVVLIHSMFTIRDRRTLAERLKYISKKVRSGHMRKSYIIIATQAVEAGVDITSNILATDAAPPTTIIQRAGRFLRYGERNGKVLLWWDVRNGELKTNEYGLYKVYDAELVNSTIEWVVANKGRVNLHMPVTIASSAPGYNELLVKAYKQLELMASVELEKIMEDIIIDYLKGSRRAAQLLENLGGSFIRNSALIPVIPKKLIGRSESQLSELAVPITPFRLLALHRNGKIVGLLRGSSIMWELPDDIARVLNVARLARRKPATMMRQIIKIFTRFDIDSFIVDVDYSSEEGLKA